MKINTRVVIDIESGKVMEAESLEYEGHVALAGGGGSKAPRPEMSAAGAAVADLYGRGPLKGRLESILAPAANDPYFQRQVELGVQKSRGGYGARGLAGSGIAAEAEQNLIRDLTLGRDEAQANRAIQILGTGGSSPSVVPGREGSGFLGLK